ncbi:MAG TPA: hypothetical protein VMT51_05940 [Dongiaceae bacterium]|nr:hypothetical protein [Dongiaceae bacterium]
MRDSANAILDYVNRRGRLLTALSDSLAASATCATRLDLSGFEDQVTEQETLCRQIAGLDRHAAQLRTHLGQLTSADQVSPELREALARLMEAQARLAICNRTHQLLLRRARRTAAALLRSYEHFFSGVYEDPARSASGQVA